MIVIFSCAVIGSHKAVTGRSVSYHRTLDVLGAQPIQSIAQGLFEWARTQAQLCDGLGTIVSLPESDGAQVVAREIEGRNNVSDADGEVDPTQGEAKAGRGDTGETGGEDHQIAYGGIVTAEEVALSGAAGHCGAQMRRGDVSHIHNVDGCLNPCEPPSMCDGGQDR
jgi:hypothetical protein